MVTSGFYDTRYYNADQFGDLFDGIITEGVFSTVGTGFYARANGGMDVSIDSGKAWCGKRWIVNDSKIILTIENPPYVNTRIDAIVVESNNTTDPAEGKAGRIKVITGVAAANPVKPTMIETDEIKQMALCWITVPSNISSLTDANIETAIGVETPIVTGLLQQLTLVELYGQLQAQMPEAIATFKAQSEQQFNEWFENLEDQLTDNQAYNLQRQINAIWEYFGEIGRAEDMVW